MPTPEQIARAVAALGGTPQEPEAEAPKDHGRLWNVGERLLDPLTYLGNDILLGGLETTNQAIAGALSGGSPGESLRNFNTALNTDTRAEGYQPQFSFEDSGFARLLPEGSRERRIAGNVNEQLTDPLNIAIAAKGPRLAQAARKIPGVGGLVAGVAEPVLGRASFGGRLAAEAGVGAAAQTTTQEAQLAGVPTPAAIALGIGAGGLTAGGIGALTTRAGLRGTSDLAANPARVRVKPTEIEQAPRVGNLLKARTVESLDPTFSARSAADPAAIPEYTVKQALSVATDLNRQVQGQANRIVAAGEQAIRKLGRTSRGADGNLRLNSVVDANGNKALLQEVLEFPDRFSLTPAQKQGVDEFADAARQIRNEREIFKVPPAEADLEVGQNYVPRLARESSGVEVNASSGGGGNRLGVGKDKSRLFTDPAEAVREGVVYDDPAVALERYAERGLKASADEHVKNLLVPLSETSAARVPPALRAQHDGLIQILRSSQSTLGRLDDRYRTTIGAYLNAADPNMDALAADLAEIKVGGSGRNAGRNAAEMTAELERIKSEIANIRPRWKAAIAQSKSVPAGRRGIPIDVSTSLAGRDFARPDADRIIQYYSQGKLPESQLGKGLRKIKTISTAIVPMRAMGDMSALLNQLGAIAPTNPRLFLKNLAASLGDTFSESRYNRWLASDEVADAASHGVVILKGGQQSDFQFGSWLDRIPTRYGGGILRGLQRNFESVTTRNRVDVYNSLVSTAEKSGTPMDSIAREQVGRAVNRLSGISNTRAGDAETLSLFAPNFLRSGFETIGTAATNGTIEGQLARQYMRNMVVMGQLAAISVAYSQGRDVREVSNPLDMNALKRGDLRLNPNFGTVRVSGQDVSLYGRFDSLARLIVSGTDATVGAIEEKSAQPLLEFLTFTGQSRGSPALSQAIALAKDQTYSGAKPLSAEGLSEQLLPFTLSATLQDLKAGVSTQDALVGAGINFFGGKANPTTAFEEFDQLAQETFNGRRLAELTGLERQRLEAMYPAIAARSKRDTEDRARQGDEAAQSRIQLQEATDRRVAAEAEVYDAWNNPASDTPITTDQFVDRLEELQQQAAIERDQVLRSLGVEFPEPTSGAGRALAAYYDTWEQAQGPAGLDFDLRDTLEAELYARIAAGEFGDPTAAMRVINERKRSDHAPEVQWYFDNKQIISQSGYWDVRDQTFEQFRTAIQRYVPGIESVTQLELEADRAARGGDIRRAATLNAIKNRINAVTGKQRIVLRVQTPELQQALLQNGRVSGPPSLY